MAFQVSPGVNVSEIDLTTVVPSVSTTAGAFVGQFQWGPASQRRLISSENDLVTVFGKPNTNTAESFFSAANFLSYGNNLQVVRAANASSNNATSGVASLRISNEEQYDLSYQTDGVGYVARYPGALGNSLNVATITANDTSSFSSWKYKNLVNGAPGTSAYVSTKGGANDQIHVVVVDEDGLFSNGVKGTVLEVFPYMSKAIDGVSDDGSPTYYRTVLRNQSRYIYARGPVASGLNWGEDANTSFDGVTNTAFAVGVSLSGGTDETVTDGDITQAISLFDNKEEVDVSLLVSANGTTTVQQAWVDLATTRKDCVAFVSPPIAVTTSATPETVVSNWITSLGRSTSYAVADSGWKYQFDKYNNVYRWIPLNGDIAGLCVRTDLNNDPWFSPAGFSRGQIKNIVRLAWNPSQAQRDTLYGLGVNPVVSFRGQGTLLYGDKTLLAQPSAFDRINVRRLFIVLEKAISNAARFSLFELNDEVTRAQFVGLVEPFLRDVKGRRGITDFRVVCDNTNNTPQVIDSNRFVGDIYIKPARSINYIQLNFVAVRTGVSFTEIAGGL